MLRSIESLAIYRLAMLEACKVEGLEDSAWCTMQRNLITPTNIRVHASYDASLVRISAAFSLHIF